MSQETRVLYSKQREPSCDLEERESCSVQKAVIQPPGPQPVSAARVTHLPRAQEATCPKQEGATGGCAMNEDVENEPRSSTGRVKKPLKCQNGSEAENIQKKPLQFLCECRARAVGCREGTVSPHRCTGLAGLWLFPGLWKSPPALLGPRRGRDRHPRLPPALGSSSGPGCALALAVPLSLVSLAAS